ncbi:MAG TPA: S8 family serine peptidase [Candidatus Thermoplasmatota archaeon]|nr:S8 family serine peptidase [Candidatus Thermoplasmatota archaeon]
MEAAIRRSRWSALALTLTLVSIALVPASAAEADLRPTRLALGLHEMPHVLAEGDVYDGATIVRVIPEIGVLAVLTREPTTFAQRQLADPNVRYVVNDDPRPLLLDDRVEEPPRLLLTPNDPQYGSMYGPQQVRADLAWNTATGDMDAAVCVIDTGVRRTHEDLGTARYLGGYDYVNNDADPADDQGHGTHVAGTAAASVNNNLGIAGMGNVGYYAVKVLDSGGYGSWSNVAAGITWCANNGIPRTVLSLSLGGSGSDPSVDSAIHYAFATKGMLVVAASGNGYCSNCVAYPGRHPEAIGVACTNSVVASCAFTSKGPEVDIAAPGEGIVSTCHSSDTAYCTMSGTSMSTPHVSGILALVWSHETTLNATALWQRLNETAKDIGTAGKDSTFGWGRIDAECLITNTLCSLPPAPPPATKNVFLESFESGLSGWTLTGLWHTSACRAASPVTSPGGCTRGS